MSEESTKGAGTTQKDRLDGLDPKVEFNPGFPQGSNDRDDVLLTQEQDLSKDSIVKLSGYLSKLTSGDGGPSAHRANAHALTEDVRPLQIQDPQTGKPAPFLNPSSVGSAFDDIEEKGTTLGTFMDVVKGAPDGAEMRAAFETLSISDYGDGDNPFRESDAPVPDKQSGTDGHNLLIGVKGDPFQIHANVGFVDLVVSEKTSEVQKKISDVLRNNRFNSVNEASGPFVVQGGKSANRFGYSLQSELGKYHGNDAEAPDVSISDLRKIAPSMMLMAAGIDQEETAIDPDEVDITNSLANDFTIGAQTLLADNLRAQFAFGANRVTDLHQDILIEEEGTEASQRQTYGSMNSHLSPFSGVFPLSMIDAAAQVSLIMLSTAIFVEVLDFFKGQESAEAKGNGADLPNNLIKGESSSRFYSDRYRILGVTELKSGRSAADCLNAGIITFLGIKKPGFLTAESFDVEFERNLLIQTSELITASPGYYLTIVRQIIRDLNAINNKDFIGLVGSGGAAVNIPAKVDAFRLAYHVTLKSKTFKFLNVLTKIGDKFHLSKNGAFSKSGDIDNKPDLATTIHKKSRMEDGRLSWRHANRISTHLLPQNVLDAHQDFGHGDLGSIFKDRIREWDEDTQIDGMSSFIEQSESSVKSTRGRYTGEFVNFIENHLDCEMMPFYFHDLRTNEIISFHAFLSAISDSFSSDYTKTAAYGRQDEVMVYNKTSRSISLSFMLASTSPEDNELMWFDVNKLVTMVYPQYSKGRSRSFGPNKFIQPFSQIPTASPMVRLRLGNVFRSNYSKFNLARLFGVGSSEDFVVVDPAEQEKYQQELAERKEKQKEARAAAAAVTERAKIPPSVTGDGFIESQSSAETVGGVTFGSPGFPNVGFQKGHRVRPIKHDEYIRDEAGAKVKEPPNAQIKFEPGSPLLEVVGTKVLKKVNTYTVQQDPIDLGTVFNFFSIDDIALPPVKKTKTTYKLLYICKYVDPTRVPPDRAPNQHLVYYHEQIKLDDAFVKELAQGPTSDPPEAPEPLTGDERYAAISDFMTGENNFIVRGFESTRGRGLAGFITSLSFDYFDVPWDLDSKMPQMVKVSINFAPIHDLPMGLDYAGEMLAPTYIPNDGLHQTIGGDPHEGTGAGMMTQLDGPGGLREQYQEAEETRAKKSKT